MNDAFRELKTRIRALEAEVTRRGPTGVDLAQAVSRLRRAVNHGDRSRAPSAELQDLLDRAEATARQAVP